MVLLVVERHIRQEKRLVPIGVEHPPFDWLVFEVVVVCAAVPSIEIAAGRCVCRVPFFHPPVLCPIQSDIIVSVPAGRILQGRVHAVGNDNVPLPPQPGIQRGVFHAARYHFCLRIASEPNAVPGYLLPSFHAIVRHDTGILQRDILCFCLFRRPLRHRRRKRR